MKVEKEDKFIKFTEDAMKYYYHHKKEVITGILLIVLIIAGGIYFLSNSGNKVKPEADLLFLQSMSLFANGDTLQAETQFRSLVAKYPNSYSGIKALYYLGHITFLKGNYPEAKGFFEKFIKKYSNKKSFLMPAAFIGYANTLEELKDYKNASKEYQKVYKKYPRNPLAAYALMNAARCEALYGNKEEAKKIYDLIEEKYKNVNIAKFAKGQKILLDLDSLRY